MSDEQVIAFHRNYRPMRLTRCDWRQHPTLAKRRRSPRVNFLPCLSLMGEKKLTGKQSKRLLMGTSTRIKEQHPSNLSEAPHKRFSRNTYKECHL